MGSRPKPAGETRVFTSSMMRAPRFLDRLPAQNRSHFRPPCFPEIGDRSLVYSMGASNDAASCRNTSFSADNRDGAGRDHVIQDLTGADRGQLV